MATVSSHWIFRCNTDWFDLNAKLMNPNRRGTWKVNLNRKNQVHGGNIAYIFQSKKEGQFSGIRAICSVDSDPTNKELRADEDPDLPFNKGGGENSNLYVWITYTDSDIWLPAHEIEKGLPDQLLFRSPNQTNFPLQANEAEIVARLIRDSRNPRPAV